MIVAGCVARDQNVDERLARKYFLMAAKARDYWGLKYLSISLAFEFGWLALILIAPIFYLLVPFFKKRDEPLAD